MYRYYGVAIYQYFPLEFELKRTIIRSYVDRTVRSYDRILFRYAGTYTGINTTEVTIALVVFQTPSDACITDHKL